MTTSGQRFHNFGPLSSTNIDTETLQPVIAALHVQQKIIANNVEGLDTRLMPASYVALNYSHQVLE